MLKSEAAITTKATKSKPKTIPIDTLLAIRAYSVAVAADLSARNVRNILIMERVSAMPIKLF